MPYLNDYRRTWRPWWTALVRLPDNIMPETKISRPPFMIISRAMILSSSPKRVRLTLTNINLPTVVPPNGKSTYIAADADEIISLYIDRLAAKKTFTKTAAVKLSDFLKLTLAVKGIA